MQPLESYEIINFFEWVKKLDNADCEIGQLRENIFIAKHNPDIIEKIYPLLEKYIDKLHLQVTSRFFADSIMVWLYNMGDSAEKKKVENALWGDNYTRKSKKVTDEFLNLMVEEKDKEKSNRYSNPDIFKCIILPFENDDTLKNLVDSYFNRLNIASSDYLDIFYSKKDLRVSGFEITGKIKDLSVSDSDIPCIALWKDDIKSLCTISIDGLNEDGLLKLLLEIVEIIKHNPTVSLRTISKLCKKKIDNIKRSLNYVKPFKEKREPIRVKLVWLILVPMFCAIIAGIISGVSVYYITQNQKQQNSPTNSVLYYSKDIDCYKNQY